MALMKARERHSITIILNGRPATGYAEPRMLLSDFVRHELVPGGHLDRGIISIYLLNLVRLQPGQGVFIPAGLLHAHLEGVPLVHEGHVHTDLLEHGWCWRIPRRSRTRST